MKIQKPNPQSGFSLIEIFIVMLMIAILATLSLMAWGQSKVDLHRQRIAREFKVYLERARFDSVKRRADGADVAKVVVNDPPSSFTVTLDFNGDGVLQPSETRTVDFARRTDALIRVSDTLDYPVTLAFNWRGLMTAKDEAGAAVEPEFRICSGDCSDSSPDITRISISPSGTVAELRPGQNTETLPTPVGANANITMPTMNCYVLAANTASGTCESR